MKTKRIFIGLILAIAMLVSNVTPALAVPPLPSSFYGTVKLNGANVPNGTAITAWVNGVQYASTVTSTYDGESVYSMDVPGDDSATVPVEGATAGNTVVFHIDTNAADQTATWVSGTNVRVDLTLTILAEYTLTITSVHGTVTKNPDQATYHDGDSVQLSAAADPGWAFTSWSDGVVSANNPETLVIHGDTSVTANYDAITYSISGNTGIAGATLSYTDGSPQTATADGLGNYSFDVSYLWSGTVVPSITGHYFTPARRSYSSVSADQTSQNYIATAVSTPTGLVCADINLKPATTTTEFKPQSKVWYYDGSWWSVFPTSASGASSAGTWLWKLNGLTWTEVVKLSTRTDTKADIRSIGTLAHILLYAGTNTQLVSVEYNAGTYQLWSVRSTPVSLAYPTTETATIDVDSTGRMWYAAVNPSNQVVVYYSDSPYSTWYGPVVLETGVLGGDDIAVVTALPNNTVGVFWSNQNASVKRFGFRVHTDGADPTVWAVDEVPASQSANDGIGTGMADDHMNLAVASDSTLYAAVKTGYDTTGYPKLALLVRQPDGSWDDLYSIDTAGTRPIVLLNETGGYLTVVYTSSEGNNPIVYKQSPVGLISFGSRTTIQSGSFNDVSSTKQNITGELVAIFANGTNVGGERCVPTGTTYTISGNAGVAGATINYTGGTTTADGSGDYSFNVSFNWSGTVTPVLFPYTFTPVSRAYSNVVSDISNQNYTAEITVTYVISGNTGTPGVTLTYIDGVQKTATSDGSGNYSFTIPYDWSGTVIPSRTGFIFSPASRSYSNVISDQLLQNYSAGPSCGSDSTLVGCWQMEENGGSTLVDGSTYTNHATLVGSPVWAAGKVGSYSLDLNGTSQYGTVANNSSLNITNTITLAAWIKPEQYATQDLVKKATNGTTNGYELSLATTKTDDSSRKVFFRINQVTSGDAYRINSTTVYPIDGTWMHVAATYDGTTMRLYINGLLEASLTLPVGTMIGSNTDALGVGAQGNNARWFMGGMDDVRLYNRALSGNEIRVLAGLQPCYTLSVNPGIHGSSPITNPTKSATCPSVGQYTAGETISLLAVPDDGYHVAGWTGTDNDASTSTTNLLTMLAEDHAIGVTYAQTEYTLTVTSAHGTVAKSPDQATYHYGDSVQLTATAAAGWTFANWSGDATGTTNPVSVTIDGNKSVTANYTQIEYTLTVTSAHGTVAKSPDQATYHYGDSVQLTATPTAGWTFANWSGDATGTTNPVSVTIDGNKSVTANYTQIEYTLTVTSAHGTVAKSPDQATYHYGDSVQLTATAAAGWTFANWSGDATGTTNPVSVTIDGNKSVTANYTQIEYTLTVTSAHGTVAKSPDQATYHYGDSVQLTATPTAGWTFANWSGDATGTTNPVSVTIDGNKSVTANYTAITYTISGNAGIAGATLSYTDGTPKTATAAGDGTYSFTVSYNWSGTVTPSMTGYTFTPTNRTYTDVTSNQINQNYTVSANTYTLTVSKTGTGGGSVTSLPLGINCGTDCSEIYNYNSSITLTATATPGDYDRFIGWSGGGCTGTGTCTVTLTAATEVSAAFEKATFADVPFTHPRWAYIEALWDGGFTAGCSTNPLMYCPDRTMNRAESAVFMLRGKLGPIQTPPLPTPTIFGDDWTVLPWGQPWAEKMYSEGMTAGCQYPPNSLPKLFCPITLFSRDMGAVFAVRIAHPGVYDDGMTPPTGTGTVFADMTDPSYWGTGWAELAYAEGLIPNCGIDSGSGKPNFCPHMELDRSWSAYVIVKAKGLTLPQ